MDKQMHMIGNAHIDPVWLWQWREGYHEVKATFRSALDRMNETQEFVFTCACACYYKWVEENDPEMFAEIRARVKEGRWALVGGMWIQPDMNTPSGESLARQLLYSQRYFKEKFGVTVNTGYNVDSFGHNATMPQLFKKAGVDNYVWMRPSVEENPEIPEGAMIWEAPDGSRVNAWRIHESYGIFGGDTVTEKIGRFFELSERLNLPVMCFYGVGNHGGGPTIRHLEEMEAYRKGGEKGDEVVYSSPDDYFAQIKANGVQLPVWKGELQHHASGCYSTHAASKRMHRRAENALLRMETFGVLSERITGHQLRKPFVQQAWEDLMFNEFHDTMGGCCLPEAMEDVVMQLGGAVVTAQREENAALQRISWKVDTIKGHPARVRSKQDWKLWGIDQLGTPVVVFNPHPFEAEGTVTIRRPVRKVRDDDGKVVPAQRIRASRTNGDDKWDGVFRAKVPALGWRLDWVYLEEETEVVENPLKVSKTVLENDHIYAEFDKKTGALVHLIRKADGFDALSGAASARLMDIEHCDTWAHMVFKFDKEAGAFGDAQVSVTETGPARAAVCVRTRYGNSELEQNYILYADADQLEVETVLHMQEKHRMLKLCFPTAGKMDVSEIAHGALERRGNGDEEHCQRWTAMQGENGGLAVLNDGKYSYSAPDGELRLTVANTSIYADHYGQQQRDEFCHYMDIDEQRFTYVLVPYAGSWRDAGLNRRAAVLNRSLHAIAETYHEGPLGGEYSGMTMDCDHADVLALKPAEDGAGYILRLAENVGKAACVHIDLPLLGRKIETQLGAWEIKTMLLPENEQEAVREVLLTEF